MIKIYSEDINYFTNKKKFIETLGAVYLNYKVNIDLEFIVNFINCLYYTYTTKKELMDFLGKKLCLRRFYNKKSFNIDMLNNTEIWRWFEVKNWALDTLDHYKIFVDGPTFKYDYYKSNGLTIFYEREKILKTPLMFLC